LGTSIENLTACKAELATCLEEPSITLPGDGWSGAPLSYTDHGDGTFTDDNTGLMWETKLGLSHPFCTAPNSNARDIHCVNQYYPWDYVDYVIIRDLNGHLGNVPFAGYSDWRLPTIKELQTLVDYSVPRPAPAVSPQLPGATGEYHYWSATPHVYRDYVWVLGALNGDVNGLHKGEVRQFRAVRGGQ
jgi:hypothetical protein